MTEPRSSLSFVGLGLMGGAFARRLVKLGHGVTVFDVDPSKVEALAAEGAIPALSAAAAAVPGGLVFTSLRGDDAELEAAFGRDGFARVIGPGGLHVSLSTLDPASATELARRHGEIGADFLSAPVQGRPDAVAAGQVALWASGPAAPFRRAEPVLNELASKVYRLGDAPAMASAAKLGINLLMFANVELMAELFEYARRAGIDTALFADGLTETVFSTPLFRGIAAGLVGGEHVPQGSNIAGSLKDIETFVRHAERLGAPVPASATVRSQYARAVELGLGAKGQTGVALALAQPR